MPAMLRQLDSAAFYLAVWCGIICPPTPSSTAGCATQVYRNIAAKGPSIARHYPSDTETPFANIDVDIRPADVPCGAQRWRSLKDCPRTVVSG